MRCKKTPNTFLVDEEDFKKQFITIMTLMKACFKKSISIAANDILHPNIKPEEGSKYAKQSTIFAANKILDKQKKYQAKNNLDDADTISYVDDLNIEDLKENKNTLISARKMKDKYKRLSRKRKIQKS